MSDAQRWTEDCFLCCSLAQPHVSFPFAGYCRGLVLQPYQARQQVWAFWRAACCQKCAALHLPNLHSRISRRSQCMIPRWYGPSTHVLICPAAAWTCCSSGVCGSVGWQHAELGAQLWFFSHPLRTPNDQLLHYLATVGLPLI